MPGLWSNNFTESIPNVKRNIFRQEWPVGLKSSWPFFLGGILLREIQTKPKDEKRRYEGKAARVPRIALKALWLKSREKTISELKEAPFASQKEETSNAPANTAGDQMLSGMGAGAAYTFVRKLGARNENPTRIIFYFSAFSCLLCLPFLIFSYQHMSPLQLLYLILAGTFACVGQLGITKAYLCAPAKEISVYDYTQVIFAAILGFFMNILPIISLFDFK